MPLGYAAIGALAVIMALVLFLPFSVKKVEEELEAFLLVMGLAAATVSGRWSLHLVSEAVTGPVPITLAVLGAGFVFRLVRPRLRRFVNDLVWLAGPRAAVAGFVFLLGLCSSLITAIIAALVLAEIVTALELDRRTETRFVVCACYAIGLGAALTPLGEPLSTIVTAKLKGPPHFADFLFLARLLTWWILPGLLAVSGLAAVWAGPSENRGGTLKEDRIETNRDVVLRAGKVYIFVMALVCLGAGLTPLAERLMAVAPPWALFWLNSASAVLDNATLAAAEIVPSMSRSQLAFCLMGLLVAGGMLIPGNIPNIVCASKLGIRSREWAATAVPMGLAMMAVYFVLLMMML
ncbi:MAG: DUF1646 family protein [Elusimicrobia bacterium]|nr:DUF1646 family protein [Elusimicrobiota bacterium]